MNPQNRIRHELVTLYGEKSAGDIGLRLQSMIERFRESQQVGPSEKDFRRSFSERDNILITYGDQIQNPGHSHLETLADFLSPLRGILSGVHLLPIYPYSSDDGFSVIDYRQVSPDLGTWEDVHRLRRDFRLMLDFVLNHISRESQWFQAFLRGEAPYRDFFVTLDPQTDVSEVVRPRTGPLLTGFQTATGKRFVWTTFSEDQIDLNYKNPEVLLEIVDLLIFYVSQGADILRLDAVAYLWKDPGTSSLNLPGTHAVLRLLRAVLDMIAPQVALISETNVPRQENVRYFGKVLPEGEAFSPRNGTDEVQMVYQFPLPPLVLYSFLTEEADLLNSWVDSLQPSPAGSCFFNFTASHDGIMLMGAEDLLGDKGIKLLADRILLHGGKVSYKSNSDGTESVYELVTTWYDALNDPRDPKLSRDVARFLASQVIMLSLAGVPGIYIHSLFGSQNCLECFADTGQSRSLNRKKFSRAELEQKLSDPEDPSFHVFRAYLKLLEKRGAHAAFHPEGEQRGLIVDKSLFGLIRRSPNQGEVILCLVNVSGKQLDIETDLAVEGIPHDCSWTDLIGSGVYQPDDGILTLSVEPYQAMWLACP